MRRRQHPPCAGALPTLYHSYQAHADLSWPLRQLAQAAVPVLSSPWLAPSPGASWRKKIAPACQLFNLSQVTHQRPDWAVDEVMVRGQACPVLKDEAARTPFAVLRRFRRAAGEPGPRLLLVAPMSGHFATLLRDTVRTLVADHEVYVTDWLSAREVPLVEGRFGLTE